MFRQLFASPWVMGWLLMLFSLGAAPHADAQVSTFDANYQPLNITGLTRVAGSDLSLNAVYRAPAAITVGGTAIDVLVKITSVSSATVTNMDAVASAAFTPLVNIGANSGFVDFEISFVKDYVNATTNTPVNLRNFYLTANDIDGNEFVAFSGFDRYYLGSPTQLTVSTVGALTQFSGPGGSVNGTAFSEGYSVIAQYSSPVGALTIRAGQSTASGERQFALEVGTAGGVFSNQLRAGTIGSNQTIAPGAFPAPLTSSVAASGGTVPRAYQWERSTDGGSTFTDMPGATTSVYAPPALATTTLFRRRVNDAAGSEALSNVVTVRVPDRLAITTAPSASAASGVALASQPRVQLRDASGNVALAGVVVTAAIASGGGTLGGTVTATTDANGLATFSGLSIAGTVGDRTLSFTATSLTSATSGTITITAGAAARLAFGVQPTTAAAGAAITPAMTVRIEDASGNLTTSTATVTLAMANNPSAGALSGVPARAAVGGVATFSGLSIDQPGTGYTLGATSGALTAATSSAFDITSNQLTIAAPTLTRTKVYDGNPSASVTAGALNGVQPGDVVTVTATATYGTATVGSGKTITVVYTLGGADAANYVAPANFVVTDGAITPKPLTIGGSFTANHKPFDGTVAATIASNSFTLTGVIAGDAANVSLTNLTAAFADAAVGNGKTVSLTGADLTGSASANYTVTTSGVPTTTANITATPLTLAGSVTANGKVYDGTVTATGNTAGLTLSGSPAGVTVASVTLAFQTPSAGTGKTVVVTGVTLGGANAAQYAVDLTGAPTATATITPKPLTIGGSFTANHKPFDGTVAATIASNSLTLTGVIAGDAANVSLTNLAAAFANATVGNAKTVSLTAASLAGSASGNYTVTVTGAPTTTANITAVPLTVVGGFVANGKVYDGTVIATSNTAGLALSGSPAGVTIASVTLAFQTPSAGFGKLVVITGLTLGGVNAGAYTVSLTGAPTAAATITPRTVTIGGAFTVADKLFDNTTTATLTSNALTVVGAINNDALTLGNVSVLFTDPAVGQRTVTIGGASLQGPQAANYTLSLADAPTTTARILAIVPPGAPRDLLVVPGDGQLSVTFALPLNEGCRPVSDFVLEYSANNGATWTRLSYATRSPGTIVIRPVTNNVPYLVRVAARNECGLGVFGAHAPVTPIAVARDGNGTLQNSTPGTTTVTTNGTATTTTTRVVEDTTFVMTGPDFTLTLRSVDTAGVVTPVEQQVMQFERGGKAVATGTGFAPGSIVSLFLFGPSRQPVLLGTVTVRADGTFDTAVPMPSGLVADNYTLQVNGVDAAYRVRTAQLGVQLIDPPAELEFTAVPSENEPAVGDTITITLTVTNVGRGPAIDVVIPRAFNEPGFRVVNATPLQGSYNATTGTWTIPRIDAGASASLVFTVIVLPSTTSTGATP